LPFTTELEGPEVLIPQLVGRFRLRLAPELELVQIFGLYFSLPESFKEVVAKRRRNIGPLNFGHSLPEGHSSKLFFQALSLGRICGSNQSVRKVIETPTFAFGSIQTVLNQVQQHTVAAGLAGSRQGAHTPRDLWR
jgi:hypothetical protein